MKFESIVQNLKRTQGCKNDNLKGTAPLFASFMQVHQHLLIYKPHNCVSSLIPTALVYSQNSPQSQSTTNNRFEKSFNIRFILISKIPGLWSPHVLSPIQIVIFFFQKHLKVEPQKDDGSVQYDP